jgi:hypothetical protein
MTPAEKTRMLREAIAARYVDDPESLRSPGCNCDFELDLEPDDDYPDDVTDVHYRHDSWCSLLRQRARRCN